MKTIVSTGVVIVFLLLFFTNSSEARKRKHKEKEFQETMVFLDKGEFEFVADRCYSSMFPSVDLFGNPNYLRIIGDSVSASIPYFGEAYNIGYNDENGITFGGLMLDFEETINMKKRIVRYNFNVKKTNDYFKCILEVGGSRFSSLTVISQNRRTIRYSGRVAEIEEE